MLDRLSARQKAWREISDERGGRRKYIVCIYRRSNDPRFVVINDAPRPCILAHIFLRGILLFTRGGKGRSIFAPAHLSGDSTTIHEYYNSPMRTEAGEKPLAHHSRYRISKHRTAAAEMEYPTHPDKYGTIGDFPIITPFQLFRKWSTYLF